jgi:ERCC4-type nuclease
MLIKIDCREKELYEECVNQIGLCGTITIGGTILLGSSSSSDADVNKANKIISENLPLGDIIICDDNGVEKIIIERKTLKDLASSIRDGRYAEQGFRLQQCSLHNHNIFYAIEGDLKYYRPFKTNIDKKALLSAMVSITYFKGFSLHKTNNITETAEWIIQLAKKLQKEFLASSANVSYYEREKLNHPKVNDANDQNDPNDPNDPNEALEINNDNYSKVVVNKRVKKDNITPENIGEIMLSQIPGISNAVAVAIMKKYTTLTNLIEILKGENAAKNSLQKLEIASEKGKTRKINKTCIANIYKFLISTPKKNDTKNEPEQENEPENDTEMT